MKLTIAFAIGALTLSASAVPSGLYKGPCENDSHGGGQNMTKVTAAPKYTNYVQHPQHPQHPQMPVNTLADDTPGMPADTLVKVSSATPIESQVDCAELLSGDLVDMPAEVPDVLPNADMLEDGQVEETQTVAPEIPSSGPVASASSVGGSWSKFSVVGEPTARGEATFVHGDNGLAYLLGGRGVQLVDVLDTATGVWTERSTSPAEFHHFQAVFADGKVWIPSAWTGVFPNEQNVKDFWVYDVLSDTWDNSLASMPAARKRGSAAVAVKGGKIYVAMGNTGGHGAQAMTLPWLDIYDIATDTWSEGPDAPVGRDHTGGGIVGDRFCVAGGRDGGSADFFNNNVPDVNCFNFGTGAWETAPDMPTPRAGCNYGVTCDGKLMVAGGEGAGQAYTNVDVFNGSAWESYASLGQARHGGALAIGDCECNDIYVGGGVGLQGGFPVLSLTEKYSTC